MVPVRLYCSRDVGLGKHSPDVGVDYDFLRLQHYSIKPAGETAWEGLECVAPRDVGQIPPEGRQSILEVAETGRGLQDQERLQCRMPIPLGRPRRTVPPE